mgnify:FL=1
MGGVTATIIFIFLSWQVLPGITVQSFGSFLLIAFLSGFSERYFLNLLKIDEKKGEATTEEMKKQHAVMKVVETIPQKQNEDNPTLKPPQKEPPKMNMPTSSGSPRMYQVSMGGGSKSNYNPEEHTNDDDEKDILPSDKPGS